MIWDKIVGEFVDVIEWTDDSSDTMISRFERHGNEIKYGAQLTVRESQIADNRDAVKALIKAMMKSQLAFEQDIQTVLDEVVGTYYKTSMENAIIGSTSMSVSMWACVQATIPIMQITGIALGICDRNPTRNERNPKIMIPHNEAIQKPSPRI